MCLPSVLSCHHTHVELFVLFSVLVDSWPPTAIENMFQDFIISIIIYSVNKASCFFLVSVLLTPVDIHTRKVLLFTDVKREAPHYAVLNYITLNSNSEVLTA